MTWEKFQDFFNEKTDGSEAYKFEDLFNSKYYHKLVEWEGTVLRVDS